VPGTLPVLSSASNCRIIGSFECQSFSFALHDLPKEFTYGLHGKQFVKEELRIGNSTLTFEPKGWHIYFSIICLVATLIVILVIGYWLYHVRYANKVYVTLELGDGTQFVRVKCFALHAALYAFTFEADSYIQSIALNLWPTRLVVKWPGFVMKHVLQGFSVEFPRLVPISLWTRIQTSMQLLNILSKLAQSYNTPKMLLPTLSIRDICLL